MIHKAKKSLGQNFLKSTRALTQIVKAGEISPSDIILEIGPGKGALTKLLLEKVYPPNSEAGQGRVLAIEKDRELVAHLKEKFSEEIGSGKLILLEDDILNFENHPVISGGYKIIANIPYNITGAIFKKFLSGDNQPKEMVLLVQKEVAERIVARDKKESILSLSVKAYGEPKYMGKVSARDFSPAPKVDSAIIAIRNISKEHLRGVSEDLFFSIVKAGFAHKRKVLIKNLEVLAPRTFLIKIWGKLGLSEKSRAEELPFETWQKLTEEISLLS